MISLLRCDDRLIHGQCLASIVKQYDIQHIIVIDDVTASNPIMKKIMEAVVPRAIKTFIVTQKEAAEVVQKAIGNEAKTLVLVRLPSIMLSLYQQLRDLPKTFNVANVAAKDGTIKVTGYARCNQEEIQALNALDAQGINVWFNTIQGQPIIEWSSMKSKF